MTQTSQETQYENKEYQGQCRAAWAFALLLSDFGPCILYVNKAVSGSTLATF